MGIRGPQYPNAVFSSSGEFSSTLRSRVDRLIQSLPTGRYAPLSQWAKCLFLVAAVVGHYFFLVWGHPPILFKILSVISMGLFLSALGLNMMHEAAHGNFSRKPWVNRWMHYSMDFFGISSALYRIKHLVFHHTYTNIDGADGDISETPLIRMSPHQELKPIHRFQAFYSPFLYSLITVDWIGSDIRRVFSRKIGSYSFKLPDRKSLAVLFSMKIVHIGWALVLPSFFQPVGYVVLTYLSVQIILGLILALVFQMAHLFEGADFRENLNAKPILGDNWMIHQLKTTTDFATHSPYWDWYLGGLNYQVEHHLFPQVSCAHYPRIQTVVKTTCEEFGVPYNEYSTVSEALIAHFSLLHQLGKETEFQMNESKGVISEKAS